MKAILSAVAIYLALMSSAHASSTSVDTSLQPASFEQKLIRIRPSQPQTDVTAPSSDAPQPSSLQVRIQSEKGRYRAGEPIRFKVKGNKSFHLYIFNVDPKTGKALVVLPNRLQDTDRLKYSKNSTHIVPNANLEFYSDRPGVEHIIFVASEKYLDLAKSMKDQKVKSMGSFPLADSVYDTLNRSLTDGFGSSKLIKVRSKENRLPKGVSIQEMKLHIRK